MSYITDIFAFQDWIEYESSITPNEIALWYALVRIFNKLGNPEELSIPISTLIPKCKLSRNSIYKSRNRLKQLGLIDFKDRKGNQSSVYKTIKFKKPSIEKNEAICNLRPEIMEKNANSCDFPNTFDDSEVYKDLCTKIETQTDTQMDTQVSTQSDTQMDTQMDTQQTSEPALECGLQNRLKTKIKNKTKIKDNITRINTRNIKIAQSDKITRELEDAPTEKIFIEIPLVGDKVYKMPERLVDEYQELYTGIDVRQEIKEYKAWTLSNPTKRKTERGILRSINLWLEKNQNRGNKNPSGGVNRDGKTSYDIEEYERYCRDKLMKPKSTDAFMEALKEEQGQPEFIEVEAK